ncbi:hypothetical protein [Acinetobacter puyangensis]|uniref:Uncharacterized protein n=1 Tax=Acinetobacter puyangensis TaxID=1096779 RepID=A0A240E6H7_9GAMM|nr:hypothetical protein [Acinetobacter puyangensis]SNX44111.1 hypothetical protein SAMN05421731_102270 [Acinetobacter puyangensis]
MKNVQNVAPVNQTELLSGLSQLKSRRNRMRTYMVLSVTMIIMSLVALFFNQQLIYSFYDISPAVQQLHVPVTAYDVQRRIGDNPDIFGNLLSWVLWLGLKFSCALIGASLFIYYAKKITWFRQKIKGFVKHILAWLISSILIWIGLSWVQSEIIPKDRQEARYQEVVEYDNNIQQSRIYRYIAASQLSEPVQDYLLVQTALLHRPIDKNVALAYSTRLIQEENRHQNFAEYGFKPEQLWAIQQQIYGKAITPQAKTVQAKVDQANKISHYSQMILSVFLISFAVFALLFYILNRQFNQRIHRIDQQLDKISE